MIILVVIREEERKKSCNLGFRKKSTYCSITTISNNIKKNFLSIVRVEREIII